MQVQPKPSLRHRNLVIPRNIAISSHCKSLHIIVIPIMIIVMMRQLMQEERLPSSDSSRSSKNSQEIKRITRCQASQRLHQKKKKKKTLDARQKEEEEGGRNGIRGETAAATCLPANRSRSLCCRGITRDLIDQRQPP